tara:strand:- start:36503 stop:39037 length:2535 start_codon:yes stop_codon:yes gene_type:complete
MGILVVVTLAAALAAWWLRGSTAPPLPAENGTQSSSDDLVGAATAGGGGNPETAPNTGNPGATDAPDPEPIRVEIGSSAGTDRRPCRLEVTVLAEHLGRRTRVPFTEVAALLTDLGLAMATARTGADGICEYTFIGGHGHAVRCLAGIGGQYQPSLQAAEGGTQVDRGTQADRGIQADRGTPTDGVFQAGTTPADAAQRTNTTGYAESTLQADTTVRATILVKPRVFATGRVVDPSNVGVDGAEVMLLRRPQNKHSMASMWRIGRSDRQGNFRVPVAVDGQIFASHENYISSAMVMLRPNREAIPAPYPQEFELLLRQGAATMAGRILDDGGRPIRSAEIEVRAVQAGPSGAQLVGPPRRTRSDEQGNYRIAGLPTGTVQWSACALHHGWRASQASLYPNGLNRVDIELPKPAAIEGVVRAKATGKPVGGAIVTAGELGTLCYRTTKSRPDGTFLLDHLGPGPTPVRAEFEDHVATANLELLADYVMPWQPELALDASRQFLAGIVLDANQRPLANYTVVVRQTGRDAIHVTTGEDGRFAIAVEQQQGLDVRCFAPGRAPTSFADARQRNASVGQDVILRTSQQQRSSIVGRVLSSEANGVAATIDCQHQQTGERARHAAQDDGHFTIDDVPVGNVTIKISYTDHVTHRSVLQLQPSVQVDLGTVQLPLGGGLYGTVIGPTGTAPTDCTLTLLVKKPRREIRAEYVGGAYRFAAAPAGQHTLQIQGEQLAGASFRVTIKAGLDQQQDIAMEQGLHRVIRVVVPAEGGDRVSLVLSANGEDARWIATNSVQRSEPDGPGFALFDTWMVPGSYQVIALTPQRHEGQGIVLYAIDDAEPFVLPLAPR